MTGYAEWLAASRKEKDEAFAGAYSPIPAEARRSFTGLRYFPPDERWRVVAKLVPHHAPRDVDFQTSDGQPRSYSNVGRLEFRAPTGEALALEAFFTGDSLFVPFRDATAPKDTYGAGRYLDLHWLGPDAEYVIDFNLAYNPYCAYSDEFSCPFPPPENRLPIRIEAGERNFG